MILNFSLERLQVWKVISRQGPRPAQGLSKRRLHHINTVSVSMNISNTPSGLLGKLPHQTLALGC